MQYIASVIFFFAAFVHVSGYGECVVPHDVPRFLLLPGGGVVTCKKYARNAGV